MPAESKVQVVIGRCPVCRATTESADHDGLDGLTCARGHPPVAYEPFDVYYAPVSETWEDDAR